MGKLRKKSGNIGERALLFQNLPGLADPPAANDPPDLFRFRVKQPAFNDHSSELRALEHRRMMQVTVEGNRRVACDVRQRDAIRQP